MDTTRNTGVDGKTFAIGVLSVTACILFVGFMLLTMRPAQAIGLSDKAGDYKMLTQQLSSGTEGVVVIDGAARQLIVYAFDWNNKVLEIATQLDLSQIPKPREPGQAPPGQPPRPPRTR